MNSQNKLKRSALYALNALPAAACYAGCNNEVECYVLLAHDHCNDDALQARAWLFFSTAAVPRTARRLPLYSAKMASLVCASTEQDLAARAFAHVVRVTRARKCTAKLLVRTRNSSRV